MSKELEEEPQIARNIFAKNTSDKGLLLKIYQELFKTQL